MLRRFRRRPPPLSTVDAKAPNPRASEIGKRMAAVSISDFVHAA